MPDDKLIARLREFRSNQMADPTIAPEFVFLDPDLPVSEWEKQYSMDVVYVRADRIEELVKELNISRMANVVMDNTIEELEAKLAKAVEALRFYAPQTVGGITFLAGDDAGKRAAAALAELEDTE